MVARLTGQPSEPFTRVCDRERPDGRRHPTPVEVEWLSDEREQHDIGCERPRDLTWDRGRGQAGKPKQDVEDRQARAAPPPSQPLTLTVVVVNARPFQRTHESRCARSPGC